MPTAPTKMKAMVFNRYGAPDVLQWEEVKKPIPKDKEVLVKIHAATVTAGDCEMRRFDLPTWIWLPLRLYMGVFKPRFRVLGQEFAGVIESVGKDVKIFKPGEAVFAPTEASFGAYAEYISLPASYPIAHKPSNISHVEAATVPTGGLNALHFIRKADIKAGEKVLINGAGGCIGTYALQMAKNIGAEITCVDSGDKLDMLKSIGADHVINYQQEDFTANDQTYDVIIDIVGKGQLSKKLKSLRQDGRFIIGNPDFLGMMRALWNYLTKGKRIIVALAGYKKEDLVHLKELLEVGKLKAIIDKSYPIDELADAHRYVESGTKKGNVVVRVL